MVSLYLRVTKGGKQEFILWSARKIATEGVLYLRYNVIEVQPDGTEKQKRVWESLGHHDLIRAVKIKNQRKGELLESNRREVTPPKLGR